MLPDFHRWTERVAAASGQISRRLCYSRKSTESAERQVASHTQQCEVIEKKWGEINPIWWWTDNCSGTNFDRPSFKDMLEFCRANRLGKSDGGRIEVYDPSRFARCLDEDGQPDLLAFQNKFNEFEALGWPLHFTSRERTGNALFDSLMLTFDAFNSAAYSAKLSEVVRRGRGQHSKEGWWTGGGAPWGTQRVDTKTSRVLSPGDLSTPGGGGVVLMADPSVVPLWIRAAKRIVAGASLDAVGREFYSEGLRGLRGGKLCHSSIRKWLTNRALIGRTTYIEHVAGKKIRHEVTAKWPPIVDAALFADVEARLTARTRQGDGRHRRRRECFPLTPICAHCGNEFNGGRTKKEQGARRQYTHVNPKERAQPNEHARKQRAGCLVYYIDADELETKIKDLIVRERSSEDFERDVRGILAERDDSRQYADEARKAASERLKRAEQKYKTLIRTAAELAGEGGELAEDDALMVEIRSARQASKHAARELADAESFERSTASVLERLTSAIHETRNIADAWENCSPEERATLLGYWVHDVWIISERVPGMRRANNKTAVVVLRTTPTEPRYFEIGGRAPDASDTAAQISARTSESGSTIARARSASSATGVASLPSAHAAWRRTNGSWSASATERADTEAGSPLLPSTTATLRKKPPRLARLMADPLEKTRQSSTVIPSRASGDDDSMADRAANAGSNSGSENLRLYGHTS